MMSFAGRENLIDDNQLARIPVDKPIVTKPVTRTQLLKFIRPLHLSAPGKYVFLSSVLACKSLRI